MSHSSYLAWLKKILPIVGLILIAIVLFRLLKNLNLQNVYQSLSEIPLTDLLFAFAIVIFDFLILSGYDFLGLQYTGKKLAYRQLLHASFMCYTLNFNLGFLLGGLGLRYRIYSHWGLESFIVTKMIVISVLTNWLGYCMITGILFFPGRPINLGLQIPRVLLSGLSIIGISVVGVYLTLCIMRVKPIKLFRWRFDIPNLKFGIFQILLANLHWITISLVLFVIWHRFGSISYQMILATYLMVAVASAIVHIPAGLGVLEALFLSSLSSDLSDEAIVAGVLVFRLLYFLIPLVLALGLLIFLEVSKKMKLIKFKKSTIKE